MLQAPASVVHRIQDMLGSRLSSPRFSDLATALRIAGLALGPGECCNYWRLQSVIV
jgi:hypothetical protein